ncbi:tau 95 subunit of transcription factor TFIIIC [Clarireedia jacksonii]
MSHFQETAFSGNCKYPCLNYCYTNLLDPGGKMREFRLGADKGWKKNEEIVPPPTYTHHPLPFNWAYRQNPLITSEIDAETGETNIINRSKMPKLETYYIHNDEGEVPTKPPHAVPGDPVLRDFVVALQQVMNERPIWTRRALTNRLANETGLYLMKPALSYVGYQFRAGPWRDSVIRYGVDPRKDPQYRIYQTLFFKLYDDDERAAEGTWKDMRSQYTRNQTYGTGDCPSHMFNGTSLTLDGKVWQLCDITDPVLLPLIRDAPMAIEYDNNSDGYYNNGTMAKIRAIMKTKLIAIRSNKAIPENAFNIALSIPDFVPDKKGKKVHVPVPDMRLTDDEVAELRAKGVISGLSGKGVRRLDSRSKRKKYRRRRTDNASSYGLMMGPKNSRPSDSSKAEKKDKDKNKDKDKDVKGKGKGKSTGVSGEGDISIREAMKTMDEWQDDEEDEEVERGEDEWGSENETTGSEDESEAEREKEMFRMNYEARNVPAGKK